MELIKKFHTHIQQSNLFTKEDLLIIAVSGGVDSIVLTHLCHQFNYNIIIAHCNFQLRGEESEADQQFVEKFAQQTGLPIEIKVFDTQAYIEKNKLSIQEGARQLRYEWFHQLANQYEKEIKGKVYILTAHHADDQIETLMMHFFRGTGLKGLTGIPEKNENIVRPLLPFWKSELISYAHESKIAYIEDRTNKASDYTRNYFRNEIIPMIEKVYPSVKGNLLDNIKRLNSVEALYNQTTQPILKRLIQKRGKDIYIPIQALFRYKNEAIIYELIHPYGFTEGQIQEVIKLKDADSGSFIIAPQTHNRIIKHRSNFIIAPPQDSYTSIFTIDKEATVCHYPDGQLSWVKKDAAKTIITQNPDIAFLDAKQIQYPLILRKWKEGDYFYPLGMRKKKKIARFMIDQKLSKTEKENLWVLESDSKIIWVIGHRIDDRFKMTNKTKEVLQIERRMD